MSLFALKISKEASSNTHIRIVAIARIKFSDVTSRNIKDNDFPAHLHLLHVINSNLSELNSDLTD